MAYTDDSNVGILRKAILDCLHDTSSDCQQVSNPEAFFNSQACLPLKQEIVRNGRKLWERQYVDGNGGNISARISPRHIICTPTLLSKVDMRAEDLSLVDFDNEQVSGDRRQTSEIKLHLAIYKAVPQARAIIHCHPPHATAFAVAGIVPQGNLIPEQEVFVGPVALSPYETPGTQAFADTVIPFVRTHNTVLLANHGIVCWADSVTHAEWCTEVIDNYCRTIILASGLKTPLVELPPEKIVELLAIKKRLGLPDVRFGEELAPEDFPDGNDDVFPELRSDFGETTIPLEPSNEGLAQLTDSIAQQVREFIARNK